MNNKFLQTALTVAKEASEVLKSDFYLPRPTPVIDENGIHLQMDHEIEQLIKGKIKLEYPDHSFLGEEEGMNDVESDYKWIVDPIDGTSNYFCHNPFFCISIALTYKNDLIMGVVDAPILGEMFSIGKGEQFHLNNKECRPETVSFDKVVIGGRSYKARCENVDDYAIKDDKTYTKLEMGAAALELSYVASGKIQAYMVEGIKDWDVAAGVLMVREMGGKVVNWKGEEWNFGDSHLIAGRDDIVNKLLNKVASISENSSA